MSKFCGNCGKEAHDEAKICGYCGFRFPQAVQSVNPQPTYQQPATYQQPTYQQPVQQPVYPFSPVGGQSRMNSALLLKQGFPKSKIFVIIATLLQIYTTFVYFMETVVIKGDHDKESFSFFEFMESDGGEFLVFIPVVIGVIALILNLLSICLKKFGRAIKQIPQMIIGFLNLGFYGFLVFCIRDEIGYGRDFKEYLDTFDIKYSDGLGFMVFITVVMIALMITAAVFQKKEKQAEKASVMSF